MSDTLDLLILPGNSIQLFTPYSMGIEKVHEHQFFFFFCLLHPALNRIFPRNHFSTSSVFAIKFFAPYGLFGLRRMFLLLFPSTHFSFWKEYVNATRNNMG